jgi:hypothetical protein
MNSSPIKATMLPYSEVPHQTMLPLQNWLSGFEFKSNPNMHVAIASDEKETIVSVCYIKIDDAFLITAMEINPKATAEEKKQGGNAINDLLEQHAQLTGVSTLWMVSENGKECTPVPFTPRIQHKEQLPVLSQVAYIN